MGMSWERANTIWMGNKGKIVRSQNGVHKKENTFFFFFKIYFILFFYYFFLFLTLQYCIGFAIYQHENTLLMGRNFPWGGVVIFL